MTSARGDVLPAGLRDGLTDEERAFVEENLGLIGFVIDRWCRKYLCAEFTYDDAWQEGFIGLCSAARKWVPERARFSTMATAWIRQSIQRGRGHASGKAWRCAEVSGEHVVVLSLEHVTLEDGLALGDLVPANVDIEADLAAAEMAARVETVARPLCRDQVDHDLLTAMLRGETASITATDGSVSWQQVQRRAARLRSEIRERLTVGELVG